MKKNIENTQEAIFSANISSQIGQIAGYVDF
jgi:hypothetical protein